MAEKKDHPGIIAAPPLIYLGFLALGIALDYLWPRSFIPRGPAESAALIFAMVLIAVATAVMTVALRQFRRAGTPIRADRPTRTLLTDGIYRLSRNPLYLAMSLFYAGVGLILESFWVLAFLVPLWIVIRYGVIAREELYLENKFGADYRRYKGSVRRWL